MADDGKVNCAAPDYTVDPDVVGPGVLAAFLATATITIIAVIFGYLSDALDDDLLNFLDRRIIDWAQARWKRLKGGFRKVEDTATHHHPHHQHHYMAMAGIRKEVITQFILTLSDQQLVTGLAILIAAVCNQRTLTGYQFSVILSQAWFSSTTHMATLDALRNYLGSHGIVRDIRVFGMLAVLVLLYYTFIVSLLTKPDDVRLLPVQCLFTEPLKFNIDYIYGATSAGITLFWIGAVYLMRIQDLYVHQRSPMYFIKWLLWRRNIDRVGNSFRQYFAEERARRRLQAAAKVADAPHWKRIIYGYSDSFLCTIPGIAFSYSYGLTQVIVTRWTITPKGLPSEAKDMSFGQIMPLLLLCLPFLAAGESYYDYLHKRYQHLATNNPEEEEPDAEYTELHLMGPRPPLSMDTTAEMVIAAERYDQDRTRIEKYFSSDVHRLTHSNAAKNPDRRQILQRKQSLATRYHTIEEFEKHIPTGPALGFFAFSLTLSITLSSLLQISQANDNVLYACAPIGVIQAGVQVFVGRHAP